MEVVEEDPRSSRRHGLVNGLCNLDFVGFGKALKGIDKDLALGLMGVRPGGVLTP